MKPIMPNLATGLHPRFLAFRKISFPGVPKVRFRVIVLVLWLGLWLGLTVS